MAVDHNNPQSRNEEILIATIDGNEYNKAPQSRMEELLLELKETIEEGGGGGTTNYENLSNQPQINGETLIGNKTGADLGLVDAVEGKDLSTNDYDDTEKAAVAAATSAISAMKDGTDLDSFGDVEVALLDKADTSDLGTAAAKDSTNAVTAGSTDLVESGAVKDAIDAAVAAAYHHAGTKTVAQLTHDLLAAANEGNVYNITDSGTTTSDFIEGTGKTIDEGSNVGICKVGNVYMFDLLSGFVDTTNFVQKSQTSGLLKNDGTVNYEIEGDVDQLKSGLMNKEPLGGTTTGDKTFKVGGKLEFRSDAEGGNINIKSEEDVQFEIDAHENIFRVWTDKSGAVKFLTWNGEEDVDLIAIKSSLTSKEPLGGTNTGNKTFYVGDKLYLKTDNEGGNIVIKSPTNIAYEADAYNGSFRFRTTKSGVGKSITWDGMSDVNLNAMPKIYHGMVTSDGTYGAISVPNATNSLIMLVGNATKLYHLDYNNPNVFILRDENNVAVTDTSVEIMAMYF